VDGCGLALSSQPGAKTQPARELPGNMGPALLHAVPALSPHLKRAQGSGKPRGEAQQSATFAFQERAEKQRKMKIQSYQAE